MYRRAATGRAAATYTICRAIFRGAILSTRNPGERAETKKTEGLAAPRSFRGKASRCRREASAERSTHWPLRWNAGTSQSVSKAGKFDEARSRDGTRVLAGTTRDSLGAGMRRLENAGAVSLARDAAWGACWNQGSTFV